MQKITVVSLGPGSRAHITLGVMETMEKARKLILRTEKMDAAKYLREKGLAYESLDQLHEDCEDFEEFTQQAAECVAKAAKRANVVYAVMDAAADATVEELLKLYPDNVVLAGGMPLSAPLLQAEGAKMPVRICSAMELTVPQTQDGLLVVEVNSRMLAGEVKLKLTPWYGDECEVMFFTPAEKSTRAYVRIPLCEIDRQGKYDHTCAIYLPPVPLRERERYDLWDLKRVLDILRGENGCPWDREQTHESLARFLIEEAYETSVAIKDEDYEHVADELGDVLLQVFFQADIGAQYGTFELSDVTTDICKKMIKRHAHIFGDIKCETAGEVSDSWERMKQLERGNNTLGETLRDVSAGLPALLRAEKVLKKLDRAGVDLDEKLQDCFADAPEGDMLRLVNTLRTHGICAEERIHQAVEMLIRSVENAENTAK